MLRKFNSFIEKWMALVTPTCLLLGVCFPDIAKCGLPYVPAVFAFMTFAGALKSRFIDVANVFRHPTSGLTAYYHASGPCGNPDSSLRGRSSFLWK